MIEAHTREQGSRLSRLAFWERVKKNRPNDVIDFVDNKPKCPLEMRYLWVMYNAIFEACHKVTYAEIVAYQKLQGIELKYWEANLMVKTELLRLKNAN